MRNVPTVGALPSLAFARQQAAEQERQRLVRLDAVCRSPEGCATLRVAAAVYAQEVWDTPDAQRFLAARGITEEEVVAHQIGYASGTRLLAALQRAHLPLQVAIELGVLHRNRQGRLYEWLHGRLIYLEARHGQPVWMTGRWLDPTLSATSAGSGVSGGSGAPGTLASSGAASEQTISALPTPRGGGATSPSVLPAAGVDAVRRASPQASPPSRPPKYLSLPLPRHLGGAEAIWGCRRLVIVEGKADQLALLRWGYPTCWVGGGSPPADFLPWVQAAQHLYVAGDGDAGGQSLVEQVRRLAPDRCYPILLPAGLDPCDLACRPDGQRLFQQAILAAPARRPLFS